MFVWLVGDVMTGEESFGTATGQELSGAIIEEESSGARTGEVSGENCSGSGETTAGCGFACSFL